MDFVIDKIQKITEAIKIGRSRH